MDNTQGLYDLLQTRFYTAPALQPPMPWLDDIAPTAPDSLAARALAPGYTRLTWRPATDNDPVNPPAYVVYASDTLPVDTADPRNIVAAGVRDTTYVYAPVAPWMRRRHFAVTATDRYGNEGPAARASLPAAAQ